MESLVRDLRYGARMLGKNPGFSIAAILILTLAIGANTAIFTVTSALLLRPFPYHDPHQLVTINVKENDKDYGGTLLRYELLRDQAKSFAGVAAWATDDFTLVGHGEPLQIPVGRVTPNLFSLLGVQPQVGRTFTAEEGRAEGRPVVILGDRLWRQRFGGDRKVIGQILTLDNTPHTIIGVLRSDARFPFVGSADVWVPRYFELTVIPPSRLRLGVGYLGFIGRLRPDTTLKQADAELAVLNQRYREQNPNAPDSSAEMAALPLREAVVAGIRIKLLIILAAVAAVLLIACANVAALLLSRALARKREIAVRSALGASRSTLIAQLLTESILLALIAGVLGIALGWGATRALAAWGAGQLPQGIPITIDARVLLFTALISLLTGMAFGLVPALQLSRVDLNTALREEGGSASAGPRRSLLRSALVISQVALSLLLLISAGLLLRSFSRLMHIDPGFDPDHVLTMNVSLPTVKYAKADQQIAFFDELLRRVSGVPGVKNVAMSAALPLGFKRMTPLLPEGQPEVPLQQRPIIDIEAISPQWFATMRVPLRAGRSFTAGDDASAPKVAIVNETFARRFWPNDNPVGKHIVVGRWPQAAEVVGVAADVRNRGLAQDPQPQLYLSFPQIPWGNMNLLVRTAVAPESTAPEVRAQVAALDPDQPVTSIQTAEELMDTDRAQPRFTTMLLGALAGTAFVLAIVGIYGVLAYSVEQRRHELGIRMALGAERGSIVRMVLRQALLLACSGIVVGLLVAIAFSYVLASFLFNTGTHDPVTFVVAPLIFLAISLVAAYVPARRATEVDPLEALRGN
jgi:putative ABC transport system permease protein